MECNTAIQILKFNGDNLATLCENLVNFGPVTLEFKKVVGVHPLVYQQFSYVCLAAPLLDTAGISTKFYGAISTQFCFTYSLAHIRPVGDSSFLLMF